MSRESFKDLVWRIATIFIVLITVATTNVSAQIEVLPNERRVIRGGMASESVKIERRIERDSLASDSLAVDTLSKAEVIAVDSTSMAKEGRERFFSDSMSLSKMSWISAALPGYGQVYNKQYWKLPILYGTLAAGVSLFVTENKKYKPLKKEYDEWVLAGSDRTDEINEVQGAMIRSNTRRQLYLGTTIASYIYFLGDAAVNYATNDVSHVKKATTLAMICPGAGQIYNKSYWKVPFVIGGFATMIYVVDWNNRGYKRFKTAYSQMIAYEADSDAYPDGSPDEFGGVYSSSDLKSIRDSYRRNRDMSLLFVAGLYILQIVDAHVDAHFKDYDVSDDLTMSIDPMVSYAYSPTQQGDRATFGFNVGFKF